MDELVEEASLQDHDYHLICRHLLASIIALVNRMIRLEDKPVADAENPMAFAIKDFIDKNYTTEINLQFLSDTFHINRYYLSHIFKNQFHTSPIYYLIHRRIGEAKRLLVTTEMKIWEIAKIVGYENANYFNMQFKKMTGESPRKFKQHHMETLYFTEE
ncbi:Bifunctional transcriptional activator/DNA repair enzyme AdaA [compost metagenome]